ncbi:Bug family tripartite tricarboxylate transporter substrate binding protein [Variovorax ginsengisoli]|uniref:Tripartite tricarboxylate transporter substrate binding protein n=1 Tax=Variovorax ginsengisoli TaxID=363844 RepID=A0ABT8SFF9_9BURK|nr:tripartite tricarboxylate transporter substrate binding protein [Variovorax ginsengisoli]MDN8618484.1 tripartite tricarboxylate transporter substrate binding protein [Variovorax ginsengisoli]MDO1537654.1 tripartite tricarboxylate transporter substrate binding protein [Variovorax ginsengisoli]
MFRRSLVFAAMLATGLSATAQNLPADKQIRIIVPYAAGGTSDILGRKLAQALGDKLGRPVIVDNRAGAGGAIGTEATVRADPDGTTILLHSGAIGTEPALKRQIPYDVTRDLAAVTTAVQGPFALLVAPQLPVKSVPELIAYAKANPQLVNFGTPGAGTSVHLASEQFKLAAGIDATHVPYKGAGPALTALMAGDVQFVVDPLATAKKFAESGKVRAIAVTTAKRSDLWPSMPTVAEGGLSGFDSTVWYGIYVPAKTPAETVRLLNNHFVAILKSKEMVEWLREQGLEPVADTPEQARQWLLKDIQRWKSVVQAAGIKPE